MRSLGFALWGEIEREGENFAEAQATPAMAEIERDSLHERKLTFFFLTELKRNAKIFVNFIPFS